MDAGFVRDRMACCYLIETDGEAAIVETGTRFSAQRMLSLLETRGLSPEQVRYVIVTHVHLDHAGGAGLLMSQLPAATLLVHPRGARHMIDPARLEASARRVYGDTAFDRVYGQLIPVPEGRVRHMNDGDSVDLKGRSLKFMDTPGHARHHFCVHDSLSNGWFSGDTFGLSYRELDTVNGPFLFPTTTPIEFDPEALKDSIDRLSASDPDWMYLTHYGRIRFTRKLADVLSDGVDELVVIATRHQLQSDRVKRMAADMETWLRKAAKAHGVALPEVRLGNLLLPDIELNTQGLDVWLSRLEKTD